ncbi:hypothetical protein SAMN05443144_1049 [Fodinibius roseus]|uniref:Uncharacterized protein n=1 Tax=Fodinibius roseus TaxID=1194090 RepID=A0A1M4X3A7_9BACT|nr:hypothetical protein [Fodinibius roseus]SHE87965.1 hypothetical protein SAMN05443144_1049 [Fodinibius roseus]
MELHKANSNYQEKVQELSGKYLVHYMKADSKINFISNLILIKDDLKRRVRKSYDFLEEKFEQNIERLENRRDSEISHYHEVIDKNKSKLLGNTRKLIVKNEEELGEKEISKYVLKIKDSEEKIEKLRRKYLRLFSHLGLYKDRSQKGIPHSDYRIKKILSFFDKSGYLETIQKAQMQELLNQFVVLAERQFRLNILNDIIEKVEANGFPEEVDTTTINISVELDENELNFNLPPANKLDDWINEKAKRTSGKKSATYKANTRIHYLNAFLKTPTHSPSAIHTELINSSNIPSDVKNDLPTSTSILYHWENSLIERIDKGGYEDYAQYLKRS